MATAKKSAAKKPARKTTKAASTAKKVTKKPVAKKISTKTAVPQAAVKSTNSLKNKVLSPFERLRSMHIMSAAFYTIFAIVSAAFVGNAATQLYLSFQTRDAIASSGNVVLAPAAEVLWEVEYRYILMALLLISAAGSLLLATKLRARYEVSVGYGVSGLRWLLMGVSSAITLEFVSILAGVQDIMTLKTVAALILATTLFGWLAERENVGQKNTKWLAYAASLFTGAAAWLPAAGSLIGTSLLGEERFSWYVYAVAATALAGFTAFALNQYSHLKKANLEYSYIEERYIRIDQLTKIILVIIIFNSFA